MIYASSHLSLAALEYLARVDVQNAPDDLIAAAIEIPDDALIEDVLLATLSHDWVSTPRHPECVRIGDDWLLRATSLALRAPSAVVPEEWNILINPKHPAARDVRIVSARAFSFDPRLLR